MLLNDDADDDVFDDADHDQYLGDDDDGDCDNGNVVAPNYRGSLVDRLRK